MIWRRCETAEGARSQGRQAVLVLTDAQVVALEKTKTDKEAHGEFESECPGYCGAQDTFICGDTEGRWPDLSTAVHRYIQQRWVRETV